MRDLLQAHPLQFDHVYDGTMKIFRDAAAFEYGVKIAHWLKQVGIEHRALDAAGVLEIEPNLQPVIGEIVGGIGYPGDETGNARMFCEELRRVCEKDGVQFPLCRERGRNSPVAQKSRGYAYRERGAERRRVSAGCGQLQFVVGQTTRFRSARAAREGLFDFDADG